MQGDSPATSPKKSQESRQSRGEWVFQGGDEGAAQDSHSSTTIVRSMTKPEPWIRPQIHGQLEMCIPHRNISRHGGALLSWFYCVLAVNEGERRRAIHCCKEDGTGSQLL